jgi:DNA-binding beta-propeller fold protein YncE
VVTTFAGPIGAPAAGATEGIGTAARFNSPHGLAVDPSGTYFIVSDHANQRLRKVVIATAQTSTLAGTGAVSAINGAAALATFNGPKSLAFSQDGAVLYVQDTNNKLLRAVRLGPAGGEVVSTFAGGGVGA